MMEEDIEDKRKEEEEKKLIEAVSDQSNLTELNSGTDKMGIWWWLTDNFLQFCIKTYVVGTH